MGLFGLGNKKNEGGIMDAIRCDEKDFLIWKWRPAGQGANSTNKENAIRTGSSLSVRPGQAAIFLYPNTSGQYDVIRGPYNDIVKTDNMPVLANIIGAAYAGGTPFQAEIYFINMARNMELKFTIPFFRVIPFEPEYKAYDIQVAVDGSITFEVPQQDNDIKSMFETWGGSDTTLKELYSKMETLVKQEVQQILANAPRETGIFVMHFNALIGQLGPFILNRMQNKIFHRFGVFASDVLISEIRYNKGSDSYQALERITEQQAHLFNLEKEKNALLAFEIERSTMATDANIRNQSAARMAQMQLDHQEDTLARMREESQYAQHMQTDIASHRGGLAAEQAYLGAHSINVQGDVMRTGMESLGNMSQMNFGGGNGGGMMNPAGMMMGMGLASGMAGQMGQMMGNMGNAFNNNVAQAGAPTPPPMPGQTPPPMPGQAPQAALYCVMVNNQQFGPCDTNTLFQMAQNGQINVQTMAWTQGMPQWAAIGSIPALAALFAATQQTPPPMPGNGMTPPPMPGA